MTDSRRRRANRLAHETSPYLLQHAENPVDWYPWGAEALKLAAATDRPILLSIGYAACHWCHVMERESFDDPTIAELMNQHYVCVKVDREERPDLDEIYMAATVSMNGGGGWPMTVFLTPDQRPFFAGTYFPPEDRHGRPGFKRLLTEVARAWRQERQQLTEQADLLTRHIREQNRPTEPLSVGRDAMSAATESLWASFDRQYGGFGSAPKFPPTSTLSFLLRQFRQTADVRALEMAVGTLNGMKNGGMYDHVGGGFARYSTDTRWLVPHFEKMLYDNAQLAHVYLEAFQVTGRSEYARVASETLDYMAREMQGPDGGYFSATDADSEGEEGKYFVWSVEQVQRVLDPVDAERFSAFYDITEAGNWEGKNVLNTPRSLAEVADALGISAAELAESLERSKPLVYQARLERVPPLLDDKVITAHNGLAVRAMAFGYQVLGEPAYLRSALRAADYLWQNLRRADGGLFRTARAGTAHLPGYLEDYAYLTDGLIALYEAGGPPQTLERALSLGQRMLQDFGDELGGAFYSTAHDHEALIARMREGHDGALPNPNSIAARALLSLRRHYGRDLLVERALGALRAYGRQIARVPRGFVSALSVIDQALEPPLELVTVGEWTDPDLLALRAAAGAKYLPNMIQAHVDPTDPSSGELSPLTRDKSLLDGKAAAYVCEDFSCRQPVTRSEQLLELLEAGLDRQRARNTAELVARRLVGRATEAGTLRLAQRQRGTMPQGLVERDFVALADTGLVVSPVGFGAYRLSATEPAHAQALQHALQAGVNLVDTASSYMDGDSERVIGQTLHTLCEQKRIQRDEVVVVTKLGYARGATLAECQLQKQQGRGVPQMLELERDFWYCMHPQFLEQELERSLARLGLSCIDVCLIHNPEYFFEVDSEAPLQERRQQFYAQLQLAFEFLERAVSAGKIGVYGISSNTVVRTAADPRSTDLSQIWQAAEQAGGAKHHFRVIQLPLNLVEPAPESLLQLAAERGLAVLTNRPLSAFVAQGLLRLVDPPEPLESCELAPAVERLTMLEAEFTRTLAPLLKAPEGALPPSQLLAWAGKLGHLAPSLVSLTQFEELERSLVLPQVRQITHSLDRAFGSSHPVWSKFKSEYLQALEVMLTMLRQHALRATLDTQRSLRQVLEPHLTAPSETFPLSQWALAAVRQLPQVTSVLVGMRQTHYVDDVLASVRLTALKAPSPAFRALLRQPWNSEGEIQDQTADRGSVA